MSEAPATMYCLRVPEFPLDSEGELFAAVAKNVGTGDRALTGPEVQDLFSVLTSIRRDIHAHPEPGFEETRTHAALRTWLTSLAHVPEAAIRTCATTGLVVDITGTGKPRGGAHKVKMVAIRADMDALRMTEKNVSLPYRSQNQGVAHMCGHDGHMASLIGLAVLVQRKAALIPSDLTVRLFFQPAEEGPGGALPMIADGCMEGVDEVYGYHNWPSVPLGHMWITEGPIMGHPSEFKIKIKGRGGHASQPQVAVDPVLVAAHVVIALQTIVSRSLHPREQAVVSVTTVHGGEVANVIPDEVTLTGTTRDLSAEVFAMMETRIRTIVSGICDAFGASAEVEIKASYAVVDNHAEQSAVVRELGKKVLGEDRVSKGDLPILGAEDFSYFLHKAPGAFFLMGGKEATVTGLAAYGDAKSEERSNCMCHNTAFDFNDNLIPFAVCFWVRLLEDRLALELYTHEELPMGFGGEPQAIAGGADPSQPVSLGGSSKKARRS
ncbi:peptidase M20, partial [Pavlovales sp. CCMP2436]|mmetsp:Transcript_36662/g.91387  ORF Transcript_36662/g.91387 Transcript_36662/m.91387 type:complete len:494 (+) Transcript_36662:110-1591(+)